MTDQANFDAMINEVVPMIGARENVSQETVQKVIEPKKETRETKPKEVKEIPKGSIEEPPEEPVETAEEHVEPDEVPDTEVPDTTKAEEPDKYKAEYEKLKQNAALYDQFLNDPMNYANQIYAEAMKNIPQEEPYDVRVQKIYAKYNFNADNPLDPNEVYNNPSSDHAKCAKEIQFEQAKEQYKQIQIQQNMQQAARQQEEYIKKGNAYIMQVHDEMVKQYGATKEDYEASLKEIQDAQNIGDIYTLMANYHKYRMIATKGLNKKIKTLSVEKQLDAAKKGIPPTPTGGKVTSPAVKDDGDVNSLLINHRDNN
jgi:hypothetical protein